MIVSEDRERVTRMVASMRCPRIRPRASVDGVRPPGRALDYRRCHGLGLDVRRGHRSGGRSCRTAPTSLRAFAGVPLVLGGLSALRAPGDRVADHVAPAHRCDRRRADVHASGRLPRRRPGPGKRSVLAAPRSLSRAVGPASHRSGPGGTVGVGVEARPSLTRWPVYILVEPAVPMRVSTSDWYRCRPCWGPYRLSRTYGRM